MTGPRQRVLFVLSSLKFGGMEKHTIALLNGLDIARFELSLACLRREDDLLPQLDGSRLAQYFVIEAKGRVDLAAAERLCVWLREHPQDIVVCVNEYPMLYVALALRGVRNRPRLVDIFHTTVYRTAKERLQLLIYRRLFRQMDLLIYVSEKQQQYWRTRGLRPRQDLLIHNGIDVRRFRDAAGAEGAPAVRAACGFAPGDYVIAICAALRPEKAHGDLVDAIARLRDQGVPARALLIGDGPERAAIEHRVSAARLEGSVVITGMQADVRPYLAAADVVALTSHAIETFSVAALEAMAAGKPLVMTRIGGAEEQVTPDWNGYLYEPGDVEALTEHLARLADSDRRRSFGAASARRVSESFTDEKMLACYTDALVGLKKTGSP